MSIDFELIFFFCRYLSGNLFLSADASPLRLTDVDDDDDDDARPARRRRLNVVEKYKNVVSQRVSVAFTHETTVGSV